MHVVVVGAGAFGSWTAKFLADANHQVTLVDAYGPANGRASSADYSRVIRAGYGPDETYSQLAVESLDWWQWLGEASGQTLLARTGALFMGEPGNQYVRDTYATLTKLGGHAELLAPAELQQRFPQISAEGLGDTVWERDAGVVRARAAVQALVNLLVRSGRVTYVPAAVQPFDEQAARCRARTTDGRTLEADAYVLACGSWLPKLLPVAVGRRIRATRQEVLYFGVPQGDTRFSASRLPVWIDFPAGVYGIGDLDALGFKLGVDRHGPEIDPDALERLVEPAVVARARSWIAHRFPAMAAAPLVDARVCQYENTASGDFIIDRHPQWPECWIAGGGSGHGFKHGPAVGRHVMRALSGEGPAHDRFGLANKGQTAARAVY